MDLLVGNADRILASERRPSGNHLVHHDAKRIEVAARVRLSTLGLLRRKVGRRPHNRAGLREVGLGRSVEGAGDSEVGDLHLAVRSDQDVCRLDVAVRDVVLVSEPERGCNLAGDLGCLFGGELFARREDLSECASLHLLHDDEVRTFVLAPVVDVDDVGVREAGRRLSLATEPLDEVGVDSKFGEQHLHCDLTVEQEVARGEHVGHAAAPDPFVDLISVVDDRCLAVVRHCSNPSAKPVVAPIDKDTDCGGPIFCRLTFHRPRLCPGREGSG